VNFLASQILTADRARLCTKLSTFCVALQAHTLSYMDAYWVLGVLASAVFFLALFLKVSVIPS
jgi:hypothetical protein